MKNSDKTQNQANHTKRQYKIQLSKKQSQWAWFIGLYLAGFLTVLTIAQLIRWAMGIK